MPLITSKSNPKLEVPNATERLLQHLMDRCQLPATAHEILAIGDDSSDKLEQIQLAIQHDAGLVAHILRRLNSSCYDIGSTVPDLKTAVEILGFAEVRNLAFLIILSRFFSDDTPHGHYTRYGLWTHSVAVASVARLMSRVCGIGVPSELFFAGLLHDLGMLFLELQFNRNYHALLKSLSAAEPTTVQERRRLGIDHAKLGMAVLHRWGLPSNVTDCAKHHHGLRDYRGEHRANVATITIANYLVSRLGWPSAGIHNVPPPTELEYAAISLDAPSLAIICEELPQALERSTLLA